ncbi:hypothetical protein M8494_01595 [Serratia ureilytica]
MQYNQAVAAASAKAAFGDALVIAGHSLGGGLAATAALATGTVAVTQRGRGLGLHPESPGIDPVAAKKDAEAGGIRRYSEQYDMLTSTQESTSLIRTPSATTSPWPTTIPLTGIDDWRPSAVDRSLTRTASTR